MGEVNKKATNASCVLQDDSIISGPKFGNSLCINYLEAHFEIVLLYQINQQLLTNLSNYNSYHTNLIILHFFGSLPIDYNPLIPSSTKSNWKKTDISKIIGCDSISASDATVLKEIAKSKKLLLAAKALYLLFQTVSSLFRNASNKSEILKLNKTIILETIRKV